jgi:hypothetical protein
MRTITDSTSVSHSALLRELRGASFPATRNAEAGSRERSLPFPFADSDETCEEAAVRRRFLSDFFADRDFRERQIREWLESLR